MSTEWSYLVSDLRTNAPMAELPLEGVAPTKVLNGSGTASGSFLVSPSLRFDPYSATTPARTVLYVYRDGTPYWGGIIWTRRYDSAAGKVELSAGDWWTYFDHRKVLPLLPGSPTTLTVAGLRVTHSQVDQIEIARSLVELAQTHTGGDIGVELDLPASDYEVLRDRTYEGFDLINVGEALRNLAAVNGGPDIMFDTVGPDSSGRPQRRLRVGAPRLGQAGSPHVLEAGGGSLLSYTWPSDGSQMATRAYAVGEGMEFGQLIAVAETADRYAQGWPMLEADESHSTVTDDATLIAHAEATVETRGLPVALPTFMVTGDMAAQISPGDDLRVVIRDGFFRQGIDTRMRCVQVEPAAPGESTPDTAILTLAPLLEDLA